MNSPNNKLAEDINSKARVFVQNQLTISEARLKGYVFERPNWAYPKRFAYYRVEKYIKDFLLRKIRERYVAIPGLSGTGKTTILAQIFMTFRNRLKDRHILYISLEQAATAGASLQDVFDAYEHILGISFEKLEDPILLLIDEVHQDKDWTRTIKSLYDRTTKIFVVFSGSSAVSIQIEKYDLARRTFFEKLYPLSFCEFLMLKNNHFPDKKLKEELKEALYFSPSAKEAYEKLNRLSERVNAQWKVIDRNDVSLYLDTGTLPYTLKSKLADQVKILETVSQMMDKIINTDIQQIGRFDVNTLSKIKPLLFVLADTNTMSVNRCSEALGITNVTLNLILDTLTQAELIIRVPALGLAGKIARKEAKYLFMTPAIRVALSVITGSDGTTMMRRGYQLEDIVGLHFYREFVAPGFGLLAYDRTQGGADFILSIRGNGKIAFEVGLGHKSGKQANATQKRVKTKYGVTISDSALLLDEDNSSLHLPLDYFLLI
ncbi:MAG: hypothetical protein A3I26_00870 [Candidatus Yanofskybacteria bacterium RIFCSPLOWO2_02_FULL_43_10]|uniref:AAA domain-containing protein n=1 Tax=Candidatus Yanofskybacteria bacterium RIFCSPLOWO2_12_FULL_43_11b TaxID=1802710 RepID=A0A1F8H9L3_9BACT|nr:MAG: hypothetical protein A2742_03050 [Candidatus Yanofskybacteria bacterium RIFCSPHIGHO2_01_FULL_43_32]OGN11439.1 MAG: hypothetical protein A3C69_01150 [Candidatus Yanofskybacteria bacterium RIFCSPHIGHO2_02_FULL_43_12]OGN24919.1 MAG: hypothetical protein A2923_02820 [Candidatus Yanofskybacteria bacterium RIFCSPLOWO2_01_FULL_43_46]OGN29351.1 MAG: hypothetical protein A3I26_00870 [Candidatus Yanofskybacteria bacterium RIFCSPLOWO2_02_FULL_43_10]OGN34275.1 MAG: hypothetical protein A3G51_00205 